MTRRTLHILGFGLPATLAVAIIVVAQTDHASTAAQSSKPAANVTKTSTVQTPSVSINGQAVPVVPNATTNFNDGTTKATIQSSGSNTSSTGQNSTTNVSITHSSNGGGTSSSDVVTTGGNSVSVTSNSSVEASGSGVTVTSN